MVKNEDVTAVLCRIVTAAADVDALVVDIAGMSPALKLVVIVEDAFPFKRSITLTLYKLFEVDPIDIAEKIVPDAMAASNDIEISIDECRAMKSARTRFVFFLLELKLFPLFCLYIENPHVVGVHTG